MHPSQENTVVRFASASCHGSPTRESSPDQFSSLHFDEQMLIDSLEPPTPVPEPQFIAISSLFQFSVTGVTPSSFREDLLRQSASNSPPTASSGLTRIAPTIKATTSHQVRFFLKYHQETISVCHYLCYYDYTKLYTNTLFAIAEHCDALRHGMAAFSALIYSVKVDPSAREQAFLYYGVSLQQFRLLLEKLSTEIEYQAAVATALQLATFDVSSFSTTELTLAFLL